MQVSQRGRYEKHRFNKGNEVDDMDCSVPASRCRQQQHQRQRQRDDQHWRNAGVRARFRSDRDDADRRDHRFLQEVRELHRFHLLYLLGVSGTVPRLLASSTDVLPDRPRHIRSLSLDSPEIH